MEAADVVAAAVVLTAAVIAAAVVTAAVFAAAAVTAAVLAAVPVVTTADDAWHHASTALVTDLPHSLLVPGHLGTGTPETWFSGAAMIGTWFSDLHLKIFPSLTKDGASPLSHSQEWSVFAQ